MTRLFFAIAIASVAAVGCKGKAEVRDNPQTVKELTSCQDTVASKEKYIKDLNGRIAELTTKAGGEITVTYKGDPPMSIKAISGSIVRKSGSRKPAVANKAMFDLFLKKIRLSRGSIRKCYQNALKKDSGLQARTVTLSIDVRYRNSGKVQKATFSPRISPSFVTCMNSVSKRWALPTSPGALMQFPGLRLTPQ